VLRPQALTSAIVACAAFATLLVAPATSAAAPLSITAPVDGASVSGRVVIAAALRAGTRSVEFPAGNATAAVTATVDNTAPAVTVDVAPASFSPNGDGRKDRTVLALGLSERALVDIHALDASGDVVRVLADHELVERAVLVTWDGRDGDGARAPDGRYALVVEARDGAGGTTSRVATVRIDTRTPRLTWRLRGGATSGGWPKLSFRLWDASAPLSGRFRVLNSYGRVVGSWTRREIPSGARFGTFVRPRPRRAPPGVYRLWAVAEDAAGNRSAPRLSPPYRLDERVRTRVVARVERAGGYVALTFDDCFFPSSWDAILRTLARTQVTAAFFCPGNRVLASPRLAARTVRAGHTIGSHGWDHALLSASGYGDTLWRLRRDRNAWWRWRQAATPYFRPPYGAFNSSVLAAAGAAGYRYTVLWDVDTRDWTNPGASVIVSRTVGRARRGSIILLHVKPQTALALPHIIRRLRSRGLEPIGLDELLHRRRGTPSRGGWSATSSRRPLEARWE
jgi:peptidoglycan/xylan/chitin deacetylase (PgdA/CDA1 family)